MARDHPDAAGDEADVDGALAGDHDVRGARAEGREPHRRDRERAGPLPQLQGPDDSSAKVLDGWQRFNQLLVAAKGELDEKKRAQMYADMQEICKDEGGTIIPMFAQIVEALSDKIGHGTISGHMEADGQRNAERWWFK